jgi:AcrR family transcriptional regulator
MIWSSAVSCFGAEVVRGASGNRRQGILLAAADLLAERSDVDAVSVDEIAARAGVSKTTLYRYFPSKTVLVEAVAAERGADLAGWQAPDRRRQILEAAQRLIVQRGLRATTMEQIADHAGIRPATIYWHFSSKEDLIKALLEHVSPLAEIRQALARGASGDPATDLRALARLMLQLLAERFDVVQTCLQESTTNPGLSSFIVQQFAVPIWSTVGSYFDAQVAARRFKPAPTLARVFSFGGPVLMYSLARRALGGFVPFSVDEMVETHVHTFVHGAATPRYLAELKRREQPNDSKKE